MKRIIAISSRMARRFRRGSPHSLNRRILSDTTTANKADSAALHAKKDPSSLKSVESTTKPTEAKSPAEAQPEPPKPAAEEPPLTNPFNLLAHATENVDLSSRLRSFANNFAVIGALWCTLSISALTMAPIDDVYKDTERIDNMVTPSDGLDGGLHTIVFRRFNTRAVMPAKEKPVDLASNGKKRRPPVLVKYFGVPEQHLEDIYIACWSASFFASAIGLGLSTVVAGIVAATAPAYIKIFVRRHSDILLALPVCQGLSSGFAAVGLSVGLDEARGEPISWIGYIGTVAGGAIVGSSTLKVLKGYKASRAAGKLNMPKDG